MVLIVQLCDTEMEPGLSHAKQVLYSEFHRSSQVKVPPGLLQVLTGDGVCGAVTKAEAAACPPSCPSMDKRRKLEMLSPYPHNDPGGHRDNKMALSKEVGTATSIFHPLSLQTPSERDCR